MQRLLKNVSSLLMPGGYFFGATPDSSTIWYTHYLTLWSIIFLIFKTLSYTSTDTRYKYQKAVEEAMKAGSLRVNGTLPRVRTELYNISFEDDRYVLSTCGYLEFILWHIGQSLLLSGSSWILVHTFKKNVPSPLKETEVWMHQLACRFHEYGSKYQLRFSDDAGLPVQAQLLVHFPSLIRFALSTCLFVIDCKH